MNKIVLLLAGAVVFYILGHLISMAPRIMAVVCWIAAVVCMLLALVLFIREQAR